VDLEAAIKRYLANHDADSQPFIWTALNGNPHQTQSMLRLSQCARAGRSRSAAAFGASNWLLVFEGGRILL
jgi:hypothetical protein